MIAMRKLDEADVTRAIAYVQGNPTRAGKPAQRWRFVTPYFAAGSCHDSLNTPASAVWSAPCLVRSKTA